jgi:sulfatase maturation enzyme AslB (radical SAM superfamily)
MCPPRYSSRVAEDHKKLFKISPLFEDPVRITNWSDNPELVAKFVNEIAEIDNIKYLHFLGGETLYIRSFYDICDQLIERGIAPNVIMGTTTNCTVYDQRIERIICSFKQVHLGLSVEAVTDLNDYIRWPGKITTVLSNIEKFLSLREETNLQISLRITPNIFSIWHLDQMIDFMVEHRVIAESCNILYYPASLRIELLPEDIRAKVLSKIDAVITKHELVRPGQVIINRRRDDIIDPVIATVVYEYRDFIASYQAPDDLDQQRKDLIEYLHAYESIHNNSIVDYLPEYEEFLRSYGY